MSKVPGIKQVNVPASGGIEAERKRLAAQAKKIMKRIRNSSGRR